MPLPAATVLLAELDSGDPCVFLRGSAGSALMQFAHVQETLQSIGMVTVNTHLGLLDKTQSSRALFFPQPPFQ